MSLTKKSTVLLVNASQKFQTPVAHDPEEKTKKKRIIFNFSSFFENWVSQLASWRRVPRSDARWRPTVGDDERPSVGASGGGLMALFLYDFVYIFMPTLIGFYDTLSVHDSPSIFCMFLIFLFTFYVNGCCFYVVYHDT
jgi:hypothetical protein